MSTDPDRRFLEQLSAYALVVMVGVFGFWTLQQTQQDICDTARENREVSRNIVLAITELGANLRLQGKPVSLATPRERKALAILSEFKREQMVLLNRRDAC